MNIKCRELTGFPGRFYAVGDIHGCLKELDVLLDHLIQNEKLGTDDTVLFIGDYIDRGPDSMGVVERLIQFQAAFPNTIFLKGNHEDMLLSFLGFPGTMGESFIQNGGSETLKSYGIFEGGIQGEVADNMPATHLSFYLGLESYIITPDYVFVHAGLNPNRDLYAQLDDDLFWIRDQFIQNVHRFGKIVVFGHTPYQDILINTPYKIGIDTGLVYGNKISCIEILTQRVFQVFAGSAQVEEKQIVW